MQPTAKLRWRLANHGDDCAAFGQQWRSGFSDEWGVLQGRVLQQLWIAPEGKVNTPDEWRDIPLETE